MQTIQIEELRQRLKSEEMTLLEVYTRENQPDPFDEKPINEPIETVGEEAEQRFSKNEPIVVYSADDEHASSKRAAENLEEKGFSNVYHYAGTAKDLQDLGYPSA